MKPISSFLSATVLVGAIFLLGSCDQDDSAFGPQLLDGYKSNVTGRVTDRHQVPLSGALVVALPGGQTTVSGPDGSFNLSGLRTGTYKFLLAKDNYRDTLGMDSVQVGMATSKNVDTLKMVYRYATVLGVVEDSLGHGLPAGIAVEDQTPSATALGNGTFQLSKVEPGRVRLFSSFPGFGYATLDTVLRPDDTLKGMHLRISHVGGVVVGQVVDENGKPIVGAIVQMLGGALTTITGADGTFLISEVPSDGKVVVRVIKGDQSAVVSGVRVADSGKTNLFQIPLSSSSLTGGATIRSGLVIAYTSDSLVTLIADIVVSDTSFHILRYAWKLGTGDHWDSSSTNTFAVSLQQYGWNTTGTNRVSVQAIALNGNKSNIGTIVVRRIPPPDRTAPLLHRLIPSQETIYQWDTLPQTVAWSASDPGGLDSVWVKGAILARDDQGHCSLSVKWNGVDTLVTIFARDSSWNLARDTFRLRHKDTKPPTIQRLQPDLATASYEWNDSVRVMVWKVTDEHKLDGVWINGKSFTPDRAGVVTDSVQWNGRDTSLVLLARDSSGNQDSNTVTLRRSTSRFDSSLAAFVIGSDTLHCDSNTVYGFPVPQGLSAISLKAIAKTASDNIYLNGQIGSSASVVLDAASDTTKVQVLVKAVDHDSLGYTLNLWRLRLDSLVIGSRKIALGTDSNPTLFDTVASTVKSVTVNAHSHNPKNAIYLNDTLVEGAKSVALSGPNSMTRVQVKLVAANGVALVYTLHIWRLPDTTKLSVNWLPRSQAWALDTIKVANQGDSSAEFRFNSDKIWRHFPSQGLVLTDSCPTSPACTLTVKEAAYGMVPVQEQKAFTLVTWNPNLTYNSVKDASGRTYRTVKIGDQVWMAENLNNDGTGQLPVGAARRTSAALGRCYENNTDSCQKYGRLYTWFEAMGLDSISYHAMVWAGDSSLTKQGLCPSGWHIPSQSDWTKLTNALGNQSDVATKLKSLLGWKTGAGSDESGFTVLPAGQFQQVGSAYQNAGDDARFWTASDAPNGARIRQFSSHSNQVVDTLVDKGFGLSIRCLEGAPTDTSTALRSVLVSAGTLSSSNSNFTLTLRPEDSLVTLTAIPVAPKSIIRWNGVQNGSSFSFPTDTVLSAVVTNGTRSGTVSVRIVHQFVDTTSFQFTKVRDTLWPGDSVKVVDPTPAQVLYRVNQEAWKAYTATNRFDLGGCTSGQTCTLTVYARDVGKAPVKMVKTFVWVYWNPSIHYGTLTDTRDAQAPQTYRTVQIGNQTWMAENLDYNQSGSTPQDPDNHGIALGRLYSWSQMMSLPDSCDTAQCPSQTNSPPRGVCPSGWHIPSLEEWVRLDSTMESSPLVGQGNGGQALKSAYDWNGSDLAGFGALPAGMITVAQFLDAQHQFGYFWTNQTSSPTKGRNITLSIVDGSFGLDQAANKKTGLSVRCTQDPSP